MSEVKYLVNKKGKRINRQKNKEKVGNINQHPFVIIDFQGKIVYKKLNC